MRRNNSILAESPLAKVRDFVTDGALRAETGAETSGKVALVPNRTGGRKFSGAIFRPLKSTVIFKINIYQ